MRERLKVNDENNIIVGLEISTSKLDEVQIIAYGTSSQEYQTGNEASIKSKDIEKSPVNNPQPENTCREITGVEHFSKSEWITPGGRVKVRIQGENGIYGIKTHLFTS